MSLPDYLLDEDWDYCFKHEASFKGMECPECFNDSIDLYADAAIQDAKEGKHG